MSLIQEHPILPSQLSKLVTTSQSANIICHDSDLYTKCLHYQGRLVFQNGNIFEGELSHGNLHGKGKLRFPDGTEYEGDFTYNKIEGQGEYRWTTGDVYKGEVKDGL